jgi:hypothetical protein
MRFGIFYEHQIPRPWGDDGEHRLIRDALEQVEIADHVGFGWIINGWRSPPRAAEAPHGTSSLGVAPDARRHAEAEQQADHAHREPRRDAPAVLPMCAR